MKTGQTIPSAALQKQPDKQHEVFRFEAGPSLYSGLSQEASPNPLKHIYQMIDEEPEWITYDLWGAYVRFCFWFWFSSYTCGIYAVPL